MLMSPGRAQAQQVNPLCVTGCQGTIIVTPDGATTVENLNTTNRTYVFTANHSGPGGGTFTFTCSKTGGLTCVSVTPASASMTGIDQDVLVTVKYNVGASGGVLSLTATGPSGTDAGTVSVGPPGLPSVRLVDSVGANVDRGLCLTLGAGEGAGLSCGDLFVTAGMPAYRTLGRDRSPTLYYNSAAAVGLVLVPARVWTPGTVGRPNTIRTILSLGSPGLGSDADTVTYVPPTTVDSQQTVSGRAIALPTGYYLDTLAVRSDYGAFGTKDSVVKGAVLVLNRSSSEYGRGWSLLGVEQLLPVSWDSTKRVWVAGDGSMRVYSKPGSNPNATYFVGAPGDAPDTLFYYPADTGHTYLRKLKHGAQVWFDAALRHVETRNRFGAVTTFAWGTVPGSGSAQRLKSITVPPNDVVRKYTLQWDASAIFQGITDPAGRQLKAVTSGGQLIKLITPDLTDTTRFQYDPTTLQMSARIAPRQHGSVKGDSAVTKYTYTFPRGRVTSIAIQADSLGTAFQSSTFASWDEQGLTSLYRITDSLGASSRYDGPLAGTADAVDFWVNRLGQPTKSVQVGPNTITRILYDSAATPGLATRVIYPHPTTAGLTGRVVRLNWNARGNLIAVWDSSKAIDGRGNDSTLYTYPTQQNSPAIDNPITVTDALGHVTTYSYDSLGVLSLTTDPRNHQTRFQMRPSGVLKGVLDAVVDSSVPVWDPASATIQVHPKLTTAFWYDALGNVRATADPVGAVTYYANDSLGRVQAAYDPFWVQTSYTYDPMNRVTSVVRHTTPKSSNPDGTVSATCDATQVICTPSAWSIDTLPDSLPAAQYLQGVMGVDSVLDPRGVYRGYRYDARGSLRAEINEAKRTMTAFRATSGLLDSTRTAAGGVVRYTYDAYGRIASKSFNSSTQWGNTIPGDTITYTYDLIGRVTLAANHTSTVSRSYYADGSLQRQVVLLKNYPQVDTLRYNYDLAGGRSALYHASSVTKVGTGAAIVRDSITYLLDANGDLQQVKVQWDTAASTTAASWAYSRIFTYTRDALGRVSSIAYPMRGVKVAYAYDAGGRLRQVKGTADTLPSPANQLGDILAFTATDSVVDLTGRVLSRTLTCTRPANVVGSECSGTASTHDVRTNRYNWLGMLTWQGTTPGTTEQTLRYDASGNLVFRKDTVAGPADGHQYLYVAKHNWLWADSTVIPNSPTRTLWISVDSNLSRLVEGTPGGGDPPGRRYYYDQSGRMTGMDYSELDQTNGTFIQAPTACQYDADGQVAMACNGSPWLFYDGSNVVATYQSGAAFQMVQGPGTDNPLMALGYTSASTPRWREYYYVTDGGGRQLAVASGDGDFEAADNSAVDRRGWQWAGGTGHADTYKPSRMGMPTLPQISFFRNRVYDQRSGRWTQEDPLGIAGGLNLFQYNGGNPVAYSDPFGLCPPISDCIKNLMKSGYSMGDILHASGHAVSALAQGQSGAVSRDALTLAVIHSTVTSTNDLVAARAGSMSGGQLNAFKHINGACTLTRALGPDEARATTNAHETKLFGKDKKEAADSDADLQNNATGIREGSNPNNANQSCASIADQAVGSGDAAIYP
jgi:YD repeat-containing protein